MKIKQKIIRSITVIIAIIAAYFIGNFTGRFGNIMFYVVLAIGFFLIGYGVGESQKLPSVNKYDLNRWPYPYLDKMKEEVARMEKACLAQSNLDESLAKAVGDTIKKETPIVRVSKGMISHSGDVDVKVIDKPQGERQEIQEVSYNMNLYKKLKPLLLPKQIRKDGIARKGAIIEHDDKRYKFNGKYFEEVLR
jgi:hypothetical protein